MKAQGEWGIIVGKEEEMKKYYSITEVAEKYSVSRETVKGWIYKEKILPTIKIAGSVRIAKEDLENIIERR